MYLTPNAEEKAVAVFDGLQAHLAYQKTIVDVLKGSGWSDWIAKAEITTPGRAEAALVAQHTTRTQKFQQMTLASLYIQQQQACRLSRSRRTTEFRRLGFSDEKLVSTV